MFSDLRNIGRMRSLTHKHEAVVVLRSDYTGLYVIIRYNQHGWCGLDLWSGDIDELASREVWYQADTDDIPTYDIARRDFINAFRRYNINAKQN